MMFPRDILINKHAQVLNITFMFERCVRVGVIIEYFNPLTFGVAACDRF